MNKTMTIKSCRLQHILEQQDFEVWTYCARCVMSVTIVSVTVVEVSILRLTFFNNTYKVGGTIARVERCINSMTKLSHWHKTDEIVKMEESAEPGSWTNSVDWQKEAENTKRYIKTCHFKLPNRLKNLMIVLALTTRIMFSMSQRRNLEMTFHLTLSQGLNSPYLFHDT